MILSPQIIDEQIKIEVGMRGLKVAVTVLFASIFSLSAYFLEGSLVLSLMILSLGVLVISETIFSPGLSNTYPRVRIFRVIVRFVVVLAVLAYAVVEFWNISGGTS